MRSTLRELFHPRYWLHWLLLGQLRAILLLPYPALMRIGAAAGLMLRRFDPYKRHLVLRNLHRCFPELDRPELLALEKEHFRSVGKGLISMLMTWWWPLKKMAALGRIRGLAHIEEALRDGKGVILLTGHMSSLELGSHILAQKVAMDVTYKHMENKKFLNYFMLGARLRVSKALIASDNIRGMLRSLKNNRVVWYAPDMDFRERNNLFAPFFGIQAGGIDMVSRVCEKSGARVVPFFSRQLPGNQGYEVVIEPPLQDFPTASRRADTTRINEILEAPIRRAPEQYAWIFERFVSRPEGEPPFYIDKHEFRGKSRAEQRALLEAIPDEKPG